MRVLVTGATGFVGGRLVPTLLEAGHEVVTLVRDPEGYDAPDGVEVQTGDLLEHGSFEAALEAIDVVYYLVHSMRAGEDYAERDRRAAHNFARAAEDAGVDRVIYLGGLGEERDHLSEHLRSRREVEYILSNAAFDFTALRAAIVVGDGSASFRMVEQMARKLPVMVAPKWVRTPVQPIAIDDVLQYLVGVLDVPETRGETYEIGGPDVLTYEDVIRRTARLLTGSEPFILPVPVLSPRLSSYWLGFVTDVPRSVAIPLVLGLKNPVVVSDHRMEELVTFERTPFDEAVREALGDRVRTGEPGDEDEPARVPLDEDEPASEGGEEATGSGGESAADSESASSERPELG
ncbi:NAD(P)H-binding protein [Salinirubellus salinus]|uniref:NAD(P)H-binding protein n=1 Tax=Salinirubellus salinus TaxID=1364945 RepID=A0A9E7R117_9EURY|nr:NAD(P)H-binding protein [Salinirubellus salinus]UWM53720.1 NAD(P)H-binding protein [Salinirubellus salinus]